MYKSSRFSKLIGLISFVLSMMLFSESLLAQNTLDNAGLSANSNLVAAYSLRQLSSTYTGPAISVRAVDPSGSLPDSEYDIYFSSLGLISIDYSPISAPGVTPTSPSPPKLSDLNAYDLYITTWYDQSGNSRNITQTDPALQPIICSGGNFYSIASPNNTNGTYYTGIYFDGTADKFLSTSSAVSWLNNTNYTINSVAAVIGDPANIGSNTNSGPNFLLGIDGSMSFGQNNRTNLTHSQGSNVANFTISTDQSDKMSVLSVSKNGSGSTGYYNGNDLGTNADLSGNITTSGKFVVGSNKTDNSGNKHIGFVFEIIIFSESFSNASLNTLERNQGTYYDLSVATSSASLTVTGPSTTPQSVCFSAATSALSVSSSEAGTSTYQWYSNTTNTTTGANLIDGATNSTYSPPSNVAGTKYYFCRVTSLGTVATSGVSGSITTTSTPTSFGNALNLGENTDYATIPGFTSSSIGTIEFLIKTSQTGQTGSQWYDGNGIVDYTYSTGITNGFGVSLHGDKIAFGVANTDVTIFSNTAVNNGSWVHVAVTRDQPTRTMKIYINGVLETEGTSNYSGELSASNTISLGRMNLNGNTTNNLNATLDEVRIWSTVRSQSEIQSRMNTELNGGESGLLAYYNFNQGNAGTSNTVTTLNGSQGSGNIYNLALSGTTSNWVAGYSFTLTSITGNTTTCVGNTTQLSNATLGGVWSSLSTGVATINASTGLVTAIGTGTATIKYTLTSGSGCTNEVTTLVTVEAALTFNSTVSALATVCNSASAQTSSLAYTASSGNLNSYSIDWDATANTAGLTDQGSTSFSFSAGGGTLTGITVPAGIAPGDYSGTLHLTNLNGCSISQAITLKISTASTGAVISGDATVCKGSSTNLKVAITGGVSPFTLVIKNDVTGINQTVSGYSTNTDISISPTTATTYSIVSVTGNYGCVGTGISTAVAAITMPANKWIGGSTGNWSTPSNWCDGVVPDGSGSVAVEASVNTIIDTDLSISGTFNITGAGTMTINPGKTLTIASGATVDFGGKPVVIKSDANGTGAIGTILGTLSNATNVSVERYLPGSRKWRFLSAPTTGQTLKQAWQEGAAAYAQNPNAGYGFHIGYPDQSNYQSLGFDMYSVNPMVKTYNSTNNTWTGISSTSIPLSSTEGYMCFVIGNRSGTSNTPTTIRTTGTMNKGDQPVINIPANKITSIGNPYPSAVELTKLARTNVNVFYIWDPNLGGAYGLGGYQTLTYTASCSCFTASPGGGSYGATSNPQVTNLESGQAFFANGTSVDGTIQFTESAKGIGSQMVFFTASSEQTLSANLNIIDANDSASTVDGVMVKFDSSYSNLVNDEDILKLDNFNEIISIESGGKSLSVESRKNVSSNDTLHLQCKGLRELNYQWKLDLHNMDAPNQMAFLVDNYLRTSIPLNLEGYTTMNFQVNGTEESKATDRFMLVFSKQAVLPVSFINIAASRNNDKTVEIIWKTAKELNLKNFEIQRSINGISFTSIGTKIPSYQTYASSTYSFIDKDLQNGNLFYRIRANSIGDKFDYSSVAKLPSIKGASSIEVHPNPVLYKQLNIRFENVAKGLYALTITNSTGQKLLTTSLAITAANGSMMLNLGSTMPVGSYQMSLTSPNGEIYTEQIMVK